MMGVLLDMFADAISSLKSQTARFFNSDILKAEDLVPVLVCIEGLSKGAAFGIVEILNVEVLLWRLSIDPYTWAIFSTAPKVATCFLMPMEIIISNTANSFGI